MMSSPNFSYEKKLWKKGYKFVVGVDEVGRGAFAGPLVTAAVVFPPAIKQDSNLAIKRFGINDSKLLKPRTREQLAKEIKKYALAWDVTEVGVSVINKVGIGKATEKAMRKSIKDIARLLDCYIDNMGQEIRQNNNITIQQYNNLFVLVDYYYISYLRGIGKKNQLGIKHGDRKSLSIAAASILAKVQRDKIMRSLSRNPRYKKYLWGKNKGYGTKVHLKNILRYGLTRYHRRKFINTWKENW